MSHSGLFAMAFMVFWGVVLEAGASEGERILYRGNPDAPFEGAWGEPDIDCGDPHGVEESECWQCEGGSPPIALPKFEWRVVRECPSFSISPEVTTSCRCDPSGLRNQYSCSADYTAKDGRKYYLPSIEGCGGPPPPEEPITQTVKWKWHTQGLPTEPSSGEGPTASFEYTVPTGQFSIDVCFQAESVPSDLKCERTTSGPQIVNRIIGEGVESVSIPPVTRKYPQPSYVDGVITKRNGERGFGSSKAPVALDRLMCLPVCASSLECTQFRLVGRVRITNISIRIAKSIEVTKTGCDLPVGSFRPREPENIERTIEHEKKHVAIWFDFVDHWNNEINKLGWFDTCDAAEFAGADLTQRYNAAYGRLLAEQNAHCPHFAGEDVYGPTGCGGESRTGIRECP